MSEIRSFPFAPSSEPTREFGKYTLLQEIEAGSIAHLYKARDPSTNRTVLLKVISQTFTQNPMMQKCIAEHQADTARFVEDAAVLRHIESGQHEGSYYFAYEYIDGVPLADLLEERRLGVSEAVAILQQVTEGLSAYHQKRVAHGDVKPANILVGKDSSNRLRVKLAPCDLATSCAESMVSIYGEMVGTPEYMSPEQVDGKPPDMRSDIFSLGLVTFRMFAGRAPFQADTALAHLRAIADRDAPRLSQFEAKCPTELNTVVAKMLCRDPRQRYRTAMSLREDLEVVESALAGDHRVPVPRGPDSAFSSPMSPLPQPADKRWRLVAISSIAVCGLLLVALCVLATLIYMHFRSLSTNNTVATGDPATTHRPPEPQPQPQPQPIPVAKPRTKSTDTSPAPMGDADKAAWASVSREAQQLAGKGDYDGAYALMTNFVTAHKNRQMAGAADEEMARILVRKIDSLGNKPVIVADAIQTLLTKHANTDAAKDMAVRGPDMLVNWARERVQAKDFTTAVAVLERVQKDFPGSPQASAAVKEIPAAQLAWADDLTANARLDEAKAKLTELLLKYPASDAAKQVPAMKLNVMALQGDRLLGAREYAQALQAAAQIKVEFRTPAATAKAGEIRSKALSEWAIKLYAEGDLKGAYEQWSSYARENPKAQPVAGSAEVAAFVKMADAVGGSLKQKVKDIPEPQLLLRLGEYCMREEKPKEAQMWYNRLLTRHPDSPEAKTATEALAETNQGSLLALVSQGKTQEALDGLRNLVKSFPETKAAKSAAVELARWEKPPAGMVYVPGGAFDMGANPDQIKAIVPQGMMMWFEDETPVHKVDVPPFYMDKTEVTNAEYAKFVEATNHTPPRGAAWNGLRVRPGFEDHPVTNVNYEDAEAYAKWAGKRLPTENEWEKAARGADDRLYPWGKEFDPKRCNVSASGGETTAPVGRYPDGATVFGCLDMTGNVWEWTSGPYTAYPGNTTGKGFDPAKRVCRGGSWKEKEPSGVMATTRLAQTTDTRVAEIGFRCAKDVEAAR
jgi:formylglycine-generating enzyme required for sulfatase activity/serine/threonine protein kinase